MADTRLLLHLGGPKCGSTALQSALSHRPDFSGVDGKFRYGVIDRDGRLHLGNAVRARAVRSLGNTSKSAAAQVLLQLTPSSRARLVQDIRQALQHTHLILSEESWLMWAGDFAGMLEELAAPVEGFIYVRPQVDFLNAAWWQWGAWGDQDFEAWINEFARLCAWGEHIAGWRRSGKIGRMHVRLLPDDIVEDFFNLIGAPAPETAQINRSLPGLALRFLQNHRDFRSTAHDPKMSFVLSRALMGSGDSTPWVLPADLIERVIKAAEEDNKALRACLDPAQQQQMDADLRWWSPAAYADRAVQSPEPVPLNLAQTDQLAVALANRLLEVERELAALRVQLMRKSDHAGA